MFCHQCGKELKNDAQFCNYCGAKINKSVSPETVGMTETSRIHKKSQHKGKRVAIIIAAVVLVAVGVAGTLYYTSPSSRCKRNMEQTKKCVEQGEYEEALAYCEKTLEIDDTFAEAYLWSADIYLKEQKYDDALAAVNEAIDVTGEDAFAEKKVDVYRAKSDSYLSEGDCLSAVQTLMDGQEDTGASALSEREAYLRDNIVIVNKKHYNDNNVMTEETQYDENGNEIKEIWYKEDGSVSGYDEYEYDENGNKIKSIWYNEDGSVGGYDEYEYDENRNKTKEIIYSATGGVIVYEEYEYDENGNKIKDIIYDGDGFVSAYGEFEYDENGKEIKNIWHNEDGSVWGREEREYDENGNETKYIRYAGDGSVIENWYREYEYDILGNVMNVITFESSSENEERYVYTYAYIGESVAP